MRWNMMMRMAASAALSIALWLFPAIASADPVYSYFYIAGQSSYVTGVNSDLQIPIYLREISADSTSLIANEDGLLTAGFSVEPTNPLPSSPAMLTGATGNSGNPPSGFDAPIVSTLLGGSAYVLEYIDITDPDGVATGPQVDGIADVLLGYVTVHTGSIGGQTTTFNVGLYDPNTGNTFSNLNLYNLDDNTDPLNPADATRLYNSAVGTSFTVTTSAVPEPGSLVLLAVGGISLLGCRAFKR